MKETRDNEVWLKNEIEKRIKEITDYMSYINDHCTNDYSKGKLSGINDELNFLYLLREDKHKFAQYVSERIVYINKHHNYIMVMSNKEKDIPVCLMYAYEGQDWGRGMLNHREDEIKFLEGLGDL